MTDTILIFGKDIPVVVFTTCVGLLSALIAAGIALLVNYISNRQQTERLKLQLQHDAEQKEKDRRFKTKSEMYIEGASQFAKSARYLMRFQELNLPPNEHAALLNGYDASLTKLHLIGDLPTIHLAVEANECFQKNTLRLHGLRAPLLQQMQRIQQLQAQLNEDLQSQQNLTKQFEQIHAVNANNSELAAIAERFKFLQGRVEQAQKERSNLEKMISEGALQLFIESLKAIREYTDKLLDVNVVVRDELGLSFGKSSKKYLDFVKLSNDRVEAEIKKFVAQSEKPKDGEVVEKK
jgi:hypothetical protein